MSLVHALPIVRVRVPLESTSKTAVIEELLGLLPFDDPAVRRAVRDAVLAREAEASTGIGRGVAIPHGRTEVVGEHICAFGVAPAGIDFGAIDDRPCRLFFLCVAHPDQSGAHLQLLAELATLLNDTPRRRQLEEATDAAAAHAVFAALAEADPPRV